MRYEALILIILLSACVSVKPQTISYVPIIIEQPTQNVTITKPDIHIVIEQPPLSSQEVVTIPKHNIEQFSIKELELIVLNDTRNMFNFYVQPVSISYINIKATNFNASAYTDGTFIKIQSGLEKHDIFRFLSHEYCHVADYQLSCRGTSIVEEAICDSYAQYKLYENFGIGIVIFSTDPPYCIQKDINYHSSCMKDIMLRYVCSEERMKELLQKYCGINITEMEMCLRNQNG